MNGVNTGLYSEILPNLFMGGTDDFDIICYPRNLHSIDEKSEFDSVATLYASAHPVGWGVVERRFGFPDSALDEKNLPPIHAIADWAFDEWKSGKKVLVRCQAGWNRSGLVMALVLNKEGYEPREAIALIRERRSTHALCNLDFVNYLHEFVNLNI